MPGRPSSHTRTQVVVVGGGPAGLMLSHLLARSGIDSVVLDTRSAEEIENTHRAGILHATAFGFLSNRAPQTESSATATSTAGRPGGSSRTVTSTSGSTRTRGSGSSSRRRKARRS